MFALSAFIMSAPFSPIIIVGALVLPDGDSGITDESTTRRLLIPRTLTGRKKKRRETGKIGQKQS